MKYCIYCGERMSDEMKYCTHCGMKQPGPVRRETESLEDGSWDDAFRETGSPEEELWEEALPEDEPDGRYSVRESAARKPAKKNNWALLILILGAAAALTGGLFAFGGLGRPKPFDPFDGVEISLTGPNHFGEITISQTGKEDMYSRLVYTADRAQGLSNGETVVVTVTDAVGGSDFSDFEKTCRKTPEETQRKYTVAGLEEIPVFDAFADLSVKLTGAEPNGKIEIENTDSTNGLRYEADRYEGLSNGDTVTIRVLTENGDAFDADYARQYRRMPEWTERYIQIDGLPGYPERPEDIPEAFMEVMKREAEDRYRTYTFTDWSPDRDRLDNVTYKGAYLLTAKDPGSAAVPNQLFLIFEAQATAMNREGSKGITFWFCTVFQNVLKNSDGSYTVDLKKAELTENRFDTGFDGHRYRGYASLEALVNDVVISRQDEYDSEMGMEE